MVIIDSAGTLWNHDVTDAVQYVRLAWTLLNADTYRRDPSFDSITSRRRTCNFRNPLYGIRPELEENVKITVSKTSDLFSFRSKERIQY
jgi:hypothetical protein